MDALPPIRYAASGDVHVAFASFGRGEDVVITSAATVTFDSVWDTGYVQALACTLG